MERLSVLIISAVVSVILFATVLMPIVTSSTTDTIVKDLDNGEGLGVMLSLEDGTEDKTLTAVLSAGTVTLSGDYSGTVDTAEDSIIMLSDDTALLVKGGELLYMNGGRFSSVTSQTVNLSAGAYEWAYFPDENGTFVSYAAYDNNISGNVVSVGAFAGVGVISVNDTVTSTNDLGLVPTIITGENDSIEGVVYALPEEEEALELINPVIVRPTLPSIVIDDPTTDDLDLSGLDTVSLMAVVNPTTGTQVGDLFYTTSGSNATVVGVSSDTLTSVTIPDTVEIGGATYTVTRIAANCFSNMSNLSAVTLPSGLVFIGGFAFSDCSALETIALPTGLITIDSRAFAKSGLTTITLPASLQNIQSDVFRECSSLTSINVDSGSNNFTSVDGVLFNKSIRTLIAYPLGKTSTSYTVPSTVNTIESHAFYTSKYLQNVNMESTTVSIIESNTFRGCTALTTVTLPSGLKTIGQGAFDNCTSLSLTSLPDSLTSIMLYAFYNCTSLSLTSLPDSLTSIGQFAFCGCTSINIHSFPDTITSVDRGAFQQCTSMTGISHMSANLTQLPEDMFRDNRSLAYVVLNEGLTSIGKSCFYGTALKSVIVPHSVTSIGDGAFKNTYLDTIVIMGSPSFTGTVFTSVYTNDAELLNLGSTEITAGSFGLSSTATVRNNIEDVALVQIKELHVNETVTKEGAEYELLALVPALVILALVATLAMSFIARRE